MKYKYFIIIMFYLSLGCQDKETEIFDFNITSDMITSIVPISGGAEINYQIPNSSDVFGIQIEYMSESGEKIVLLKSYSSTQVELKGFNKASNNIPAKMYLISCDKKLSKPINFSFETLSSSAESIHDNLEVNSFWGGFQVDYIAPNNSDGFIHIGYEGLDPKTGKKGVIYKDTEIIKPGTNSIQIGNIVNESGIINAVIWTEDFMGNIVKETRKEVEPYIVTQYNSENLSFIGNSYEDDFVALSQEYLFDGDKNGVQELQHSGEYLSYCFLLDNPVTIKPVCFIELKDPQIIASLRYYIPLNNGESWPWPLNWFKHQNIPCHMKVYLTNEIDNRAEWTSEVEFYQNKSLDKKDWWCYPLINTDNVISDIDILKNATSCYQEFTFNVSKVKYKYIAIEFLDCFGDFPDMPMCQEIEVFVKQ